MLLKPFSHWRNNLIRTKVNHKIRQCKTGQYFSIRWILLIIIRLKSLSNQRMLEPFRWNLNFFPKYSNFETFYFYQTLFDWKLNGRFVLTESSCWVINFQQKMSNSKKGKGKEKPLTNSAKSSILDAWLVLTKPLRRPTNS